MATPARQPAHVITVLNLKGGVGKTHSVWLLASVCQERQKRVLLIDTDTQGNLSGSFADRDRQPGVEPLFDPAADASPEPLIRHTPFNCIDIITASPALARFDESDQRAWERADLHLSLVDPVAQLRRQYDMIVFDCPPCLSLVSFAVARTSIEPITHCSYAGSTRQLAC